MSTQLDAEWAAICAGVTEALAGTSPIATIRPTAILSGDPR
ncbi:hypothetical protein PBI_DEWDROP_129 [Microbacterium phage Dewdrop]|nr:hypothetical protein PBI_LEAF_129 [Microbacterium phage Leaf]QGZ17497.1 hypothetical protein PBI_DEWDROP_129 [Microbacterium phage Dewdrop]